MADVKSRAKAAVVGSLVADAASMPLHWMYDHSELDSKLLQMGKEEAPEFYNPPYDKFYSYELGHLSPYGAPPGQLGAAWRRGSSVSMSAGPQRAPQLLAPMELCLLSCGCRG